MKLSLRKAHKLVKDLEPMLRVSTVAMNVHHSETVDGLKKAYTQCTNENAEIVKKALTVAELIQEIRVAIQNENHRRTGDMFSIDELLAEKTRVERKMMILAKFRPSQNDNDVRTFVSGDAETEDAAFVNYQRRFNDLKSDISDNSYSSDNSIRISGYSTADNKKFGEMYIGLKHRQEEIIDELSYLNNSLSITIDDKYVDMLKAFGLLN